MAAVGQIARWQWLPIPGRRWRIVTRVDAGDEVPRRLPRSGAALVGPVSAPTWIAFDCPCGQGHRLMINTSPSRRPTWRIQSEKPLTIRPSIDDTTPERRCHFSIDKGRVRWANNRRRNRR